MKLDTDDLSNTLSNKLYLRDSLVLSLVRRPNSQNSPTPDDDVFKHLAQVYSFSHETMYQGQACPSDQKGFPNGTTNGAQWYLLEGK